MVGYNFPLRSLKMIMIIQNDDDGDDDDDDTMKGSWQLAVGYDPRPFPLHCEKG